MTNDASPAGHADRPASSRARDPQARFEFLPASEREPATVRAAGDIDLTNVGQFQAALDQAAATSSAITADMTAVSYCDSATIRALFIAARRARLTIQVSTAGPINETLLEVSGLDQIATVITLDKPRTDPD
jgi:anti-anti-sigma factor